MLATAARVLLIEDDPSLRRVVELNLAARGYEVDVAASGSAALELTERRPDLVVADLGLPDMDGIDLITRLRTSVSTPILVVSARGAQTGKALALAAGADGYLAKPFGIDQLVRLVRSVLSTQEPPNGDPLRSSA